MLVNLQDLILSRHHPSTTKQGLLLSPTSNNSQTLKNTNMILEYLTPLVIKKLLIIDIYINWGMNTAKHSLHS